MNLSLFHTGNTVLDLTMTILFAILLTYPILGGLAWFFWGILLQLSIQIPPKNMGRYPKRNRTFYYHHGSRS
ncbi:Glycosyltransferase, family 2, cellulose synthase (CESA) superfamily protein [Listeria fleischmannii FSL S10-1203]|uniref:Glycosyltransferase, family 2, cellulose synthase (CESA) superfamily protein n=1 Tax=Listeria fleischmannii FSL S10-1203 TaxID=1265822 RepID=W7DWF2_9LIST|nr:Glycosyltransferase, family 2, cellulose synthase (CESA) superfamily protein [Listeria fleischmannii FSL S10-1203]